MHCKNAKTLSRHTHMPGTSSFGMMVSRDVVGDVGEVDSRQLSLPAGDAKALVDGRILHEAVVQDDPRDAFDDLDDFGAILVRDAWRFRDQHRDQHNALVENAIVLERRGMDLRPTEQSWAFPLRQIDPPKSGVSAVSSCCGD